MKAPSLLPKWQSVDWSQTNGSIAATMGVGRTRVQQVRKQLGIPPVPVHPGPVTRENARDFVTVDPATGCWLWKQSSDNRGGYGQKRIGRKNWGAHRLYFELFNGPIPDGLGVLHHCDTPRCVNPAHLFVGTDADNRRDAASKGRIPGNRKATDDAIREARRLSGEGLSYRAIGLRVGLSAGSVCRVVNGKQRRAS